MSNLDIAIIAGPLGFLALSMIVLGPIFYVFVVKGPRSEHH